MANHIVFNYEEMQKCVNKINEIADSYLRAANTFDSQYREATSAWTGLTKNKMDLFVVGDSGVLGYMKNSVPELVKGLATLLQANLDQMSSADSQIADNIPASLS